MGKKYVLTGGEAVGFNDIAQNLGVTYKPLTMDEARARLKSKGTARDQIDATLAISAYQKAGGPRKNSRIAGSRRRVSYRQSERMRKLPSGTIANVYEPP